MSEQKAPVSWRYRLSKLSIYLPILLMAVFAAATGWLVSKTPKIQREHAPVVAVHEPDYILTSFISRSFSPEGNLRTEMFGEKGVHYPDNNFLEAQEIRIRSIAENGRITTASAKQGSANSDHTIFKLQGDAVVLQPPFGKTDRLEFQGQELQIFSKEDRVQSDLPVVILRGKDRLTGNQLNYSNKNQDLQVQGRVHSTLEPKK